MDGMKIIVAERMADVGVELLKREFEVDTRYGISQAELLEVIGEYDALIVRSAIKVNEQLLERGTRLKVVGRAGNGIDNIDVAACTNRGVLVANTPDSNTISAAEHTIGLLLAAARNIPAATMLLKQGGWGRNQFKGSEIFGKTVGIVGLGRIGSMVATRLAAFGAKVIAYDPYIPEERFQRFGVERVEALNDLVRRADIITVHTPKTEETYGMIGREQFQICRKGVRVVNCARGGIINEEALGEALENGTVASAGIDVFVEEPCVGNALFKHDKVVMTPHCGASTEEAQNRVGISIAMQVQSALRGEVVPNAVNLPELMEEELPALKPYLELSSKLGRLYFQLYKEPVERLELSYSGKIARKETKMVTIAFVKGLLDTVLPERVNYVNAILLAESRGIRIHETKEEKSTKGFNSLITADIYSRNGKVTLAGAFTGDGKPRIVEVNGYPTDITPTGNILFVENIDRPGVIGPFANILGQANVNIAMMQVGRHVKGEVALMTMNVDSDVDEATKRQLKEVDGILSVKAVCLD
jgi:D-3-phosphoglycerate dehydrogenase